MDIIIFSGQSNMQGSTGEKDNRKSFKGCYEYKYLTDSIVPLINPVGEDIEGDILWASGEGNGSLVPSFCDEYKKLTKRDILAIHIARGGTRIDEWGSDTKRLSIAIDKVKKGIAKAKESYNIQNIYVVWLQGESDAVVERGKEEYLKMLIELKNNFKREFEFDKFGIIRVGYFACYAPWMHGHFLRRRLCDRAIMKAQEKVPKIDKDFVLISKITAKFSQNKKYLNPKEHGPHYNNKAMDIIGRDSAKGLVKKLNCNK